MSADVEESVTPRRFARCSFWRRATTPPEVEHSFSAAYTSAPAVEYVAEARQAVGWLLRWICSEVMAASRIREVQMSQRKNSKSMQRGHYCWACDRRQPNEKFSGRGHARHLCRDCANLGSEELAYRQACRDLQRCMTWEGIIPRKRRKSFERFLHHDDTRIRALAKQMQAEDEATHKLLRVDREFDEIAAAWSTFHTDSD